MTFLFLLYNAIAAMCATDTEFAAGVEAVNHALGTDLPFVAMFFIGLFIAIWFDITVSN